MNEWLSFESIASESGSHLCVLSDYSIYIISTRASKQYWWSVPQFHTHIDLRCFTPSNSNGSSSSLKFESFSLSFSFKIFIRLWTIIIDLTWWRSLIVVDVCVVTRILTRRQTKKKSDEYVSMLFVCMLFVCISRPHAGRRVWRPSVSFKQPTTHTYTATTLQLPYLLPYSIPGLIEDANTHKHTISLHESSHSSGGGGGGDSYACMRCVWQQAYH